MIDRLPMGGILADRLRKRPCLCQLEGEEGEGKDGGKSEQVGLAPLSPSFSRALG